MRLRLTIHAHTEQNQRPEQSDRYLILPVAGGALTAVMDGVGCHKYGDSAAESVVSSFKAYNQENLTAFNDSPLRALDCSMIRAREDMLGFLGATTCTALVVMEDGGAFIAHIGDSAAFRLRAGVLEQLTQPHRFGRHLLSHAIHGEEASEWRASCQWKSWKLDDVMPGDVYLVATDGCYEDIATSRMSELLAGFIDDAPPPQIHPRVRKMLHPMPIRIPSIDDRIPFRGTNEPNPAEMLVKAAISNGATDNSTAIVVRVGAS